MEQPKLNRTESIKGGGVTLPLFLVSAAIFATILMNPRLALGQEWQLVHGGKPFGISGMALVQHHPHSDTFLVVHDNKAESQGRLAMIHVRDQNPPQYFPLTWPNGAALPDDLEAITAVPGTSPLSFMATTSTGQVYHFQLGSNNQVILLKAFNLPTAMQGNLEGLAIQLIQGNLLLVCAHRGKNNDPAKLYWGLIDLNTYQITLQGAASIKVPWPSGNVRHISDLKVDPVGVLYLSAATDPGDDGPFQSAVYIAGNFTGNFSGNHHPSRHQWHQFNLNSPLVPLYRYNDHKIEAIELIPGIDGGIIVGSDDENMGGSINIYQSDGIRNSKAGI